MAKTASESIRAYDTMVGEAAEQIREILIKLGEDLDSCNRKRNVVQGVLTVTVDSFGEPTTFERTLML